jgi:hypothetical protein
MQKISHISLIFIVTLILSFAIRGNRASLSNNDTYLSTKIGSPFESSHSAARYALTKSIVDNHSLFLGESLAAIASPDLSKINNQYISIFTPGVSFIGVPAYVLGKYLGYPQLTTYIFFLLISILNLYLLSNLSQNLGVSRRISIVAGLIFIFATNSYVYSNTLTQHNLSTFLVLTTLIITIKKRTLFNNFIFGICYGLAVLVDIPNLFLIMPQALYLAYQHVSLKAKSINPIILGIALGVLPFMVAFGIYNQQVTGNPFKLGQRLGRAIYPPEATLDTQKIVQVHAVAGEKFKQFDTRRQINGYYILLFSKTRGLLRYSPIALLGILGYFIAYKDKKQPNTIHLFVAVIFLNIFIYSIFNDPWGGWAFGPRYLIPTTALFVVGLSVLIQKYYNRLLFNLIFIPLLLYGIALSTAGAITTSVVPPDVYTQNISTPLHSNYKYNFDLISANSSGSLVYSTLFMPKYQLRDYYHFVVMIISALILTIYISYIFHSLRGK